jgi:Protein of unknown function (Hypoth_ymh)
VTNPAWKSIADAAPTLEALKKLSFDRQILVLLARLHVMYPQMANTGGLIWENLRMPAYALTLGYDDSREGTRVMDYMMGRPWTELINRGYLVQNGSISYRISEEGETALASLTGPLLSRASLEAITLLHPDLAEAERDFREGRFTDAVRDAFRIFENRLNTMRDASADTSLQGKSGKELVYPFVQSSSFGFPYPALSTTDPKRQAAYRLALGNLYAGALGLIRNAYDHEAYNLAPLDERAALELLYFASYLLRLLDLS